MRVLFFLLFCLGTIFTQAQPAKNYTVSNAHSHNDYQNQFPFKQAYNAGFGSVEADIFLEKGKIFLAHHKKDIAQNRLLEKEYLIPLRKKINENGGSPFSDKSKSLQLLIDIKSEAAPTLQALLKVLSGYPSIIRNKNIRIVISGSRPPTDTWKIYPTYILFDGNFNENYSPEELKKIGLYSADIRDYTNWNGKSNLPADDIKKINSLIAKAHASRIPVRFWATPDFVNAWYQLMNLNIDYISTDKIFELKNFLNDLPKNTFHNKDFYTLYKPQYRNDGQNKKIKNIILFIGDGCGLAHLYAGFTANKSRLNIFNMRGSGNIKTDSYDSYITDSAPGSTAFSSGHKTCNRFVGVDHTGTALKLLPEYLHEKKIKTGLITTGNVTDATPADFYGHNTSRDNAAAMFYELAKSPVSLLIGSADDAFNNEIQQKLQQENFVITDDVAKVNDATKRWLVMQQQARHSVLNGRKEWMRTAFDKAVNMLKDNKDGFFLMIEAAQIDYGGHAMNLPYVTTEVMDMDKTVGEAMRFADTNGETLVIVLADHETGGLTLLDGNLKTGYVAGHFSTNDHTAVPIPVFAYGPQSCMFTGFYENTDVFEKILQAFGIKK